MLLVSTVLTTVHTLRMAGHLTVAGNSSKRFLRHFCIRDLPLYEHFYVQRSDLSQGLNCADPAILGAIKLL